MKIKITKEIPVQANAKPEVGGIYEVKSWDGTKRRSERMYYIEVNGNTVGIYGYECEDVEGSIDEVEVEE